jgi:hypothetical protein
MSISHFDPNCDIRAIHNSAEAVQKGPGRCRGLKFAGDRKLDQYFPVVRLPQLKW